MYTSLCVPVLPRFVVVILSTYRFPNSRKHINDPIFGSSLVNKMVTHLVVLIFILMKLTKQIISSNQTTGSWVIFFPSKKIITYTFFIVVNYSNIKPVTSLNWGKQKNSLLVCFFNHILSRFLFPHQWILILGFTTVAMVLWMAHHRCYIWGVPV